MKKLYLLKTFLFVLIFFIITIPLSFLLKNDVNSYARSLFHEFYSQPNIDYLICGASHVSHGVEANIASKRMGKYVFNAGTPSQKIDGTYAIIKQAIKLYNIEKIFLELDFAITCDEPFFERTGFKAEYIVLDGLKDISLKTDYLIHCSRPSYYLNSLLPIGKDKLITLNPKIILKKIRAYITGEYFKYQFIEDGSEYAGKGCVLDLKEIPTGGFSNNSKESPIPIERICDDWKNTIDKIIDLCLKNNIKLIFYSMPGSDFYLNERGNYDEYYAFCRDFINIRGGKYFDFNLVKPNILSLSDNCFHDDNHLSKKGVYEWTDAFCDFFDAKYKEQNVLEKYFYSSYAEKMTDMPDTIFGLYMISSADRKSMKIIPVSNYVDSSRITYDVYALYGTEEIILNEKTNNPTVFFPSGKSGKIRVISYLDGVKQTDCTENFASF